MFSWFGGILWIVKPSLLLSQPIKVREIDSEEIIILRALQRASYPNPGESP
jgi:hypothetical protein